MQNIGVISDTHGLLRPEAAAALRGCDLIVHAGDVGDPAILEELGAIAPMVAVRGNIDKGGWATKLPEREVVELDDCRMLVLHNRDELDLDPRAAGFHAVIAGHSHRPSIETRNGVLHLNPGSAGPRRFRLPVTVGWITLMRGEPAAKIIDIGGERAMPIRSGNRLLQAMARATKGM
jgi:putative phosphoesterase